MSRHDLLENIAVALKAFAAGKLENSALNLFDTLGYHSNRRIEGLQLSAENLAETFNSSQNLRPEKALTADWEAIHLLFQLTDDEITAAARERQLRMVFDSGSRVDPTIYRSYIFFAIALQGAAYSRGQLATITREVNRLFPIPVMLLFQHGNTLSLGVIHRRPHRRQIDQDVLEKVTLIKDIRIANPHRAHLEILADLALPELYEHHPFTNFLELHQAWQDTLNISELNKRFYQELANWYFWAIKTVHFSASTEDEAMNVIRLITRLIFVWFLKELNLIPDDLFDHRKLEPIVKFNQPGDTIYYKAILQNLFFATLSQEMNTPEHPRQRSFRTEPSRAGGLTSDYMVHGKYRYKTLFIQPDRALELFANIPFLNGGLFECLDRKLEDGRELRPDGFSDRPKNPLHVPDYLFFDTDHFEDLNEIFGTRGKRYPVRGLIRLLNHYKFTIEENTPIEEEVALDPELLGKVFENLLASYNPETQTTARKLTGSFYTPREIVDYMVDESLIAYLQSEMLDRFPSLDEAKLEEHLRHLLAYNDEPHQFSSSEAQALITAIDQVKVIDPAVGSGAFPMGMLHKLVYLLGRLDPGNAGWKERQLQKAREIPDSEIRRQVLEDIEQAFETHQLDYGRKLYLIENCIYGVDIQPIAVQIAKLRVFISLVVDQCIDDSLPNRGIRPLPNLETRFVAANTLLSLELPTKATSSPATSSGWPVDVQLETLGRELLSVLEQYRKVQNDGTRARYRGYCQETIAEINQRLEALGSPQRLEAAALLAKADFNLEAAGRDLPGYQAPQAAKAIALRSQDIAQKENDLAEVRRRYFTARTYQTKEKYRQRDDEIRAALAELLQKSGQLEPEVSHKLAAWSPYEQTQSADFFDPDWMFGVTQGFNIVLGNPPYVRQEQIKEFKPELQQRYRCYTGTADLYVYFYERGLQLLRPGGVLSYISSNKYLRSAYGEKLRQTLAEKTTIRQLIDFGDASVFTAIAYPSIIVLVKLSTPSNLLRALTWEIGDPIETFVETFQSRGFFIAQDELSSASWRLEHNDVLRLMERLQNTGKPLWDYVDGGIYMGIKTGLNEAMIVDQATLDRLVFEHLSSADILKPFLRGRDLKRWRINYSGQYLIKIESSENKPHPWTGKSARDAENIFEETYPAIHAHLSNFREALIQREDQGKYYWELRSCAYWDAFDKPKIIYPDIYEHQSFAFDTEGYYSGNTTYFIPLPDKWLCGLFNSVLVEWFYSHISNKLQSGYLRAFTDYMKQIPIPNISPSQKTVLNILVEYLLSLSNDAQSPNALGIPNRIAAHEIEDLLNGLVYELYIPENIQSKGLGVFELASPVLSQGIQATYQALRDPNSELRARLIRQNIEVEEIRIINEALKK